MGANLHSDYISMSARTRQQFKLPKNYTIQFSAFGLAPQQGVQGKFLGFITSDLAVDKIFCNDNASISARVSDVFNTRRFRIITSDPQFNLRTEYYRVSRILFLTFTYKFNNYKEQKRRGGEPNGGGAMDFEGGD